MNRVHWLIFMICICATLKGQTSITIKTEQPGVLKTQIANIETVENLTVKGYLNETDFKVMKNMVNQGNLKHIDIFDCSIISEPEVLNNIVPVNAFTNCSKLVSIKLPKNILGIADFAFMGCENLTNIEFPSTLKSIGARSFESCITLTEVILPNSVERIANSFGLCKNLKKVTLSDNLLYLGDGAFNSCKLTNIVLPEYLEFIGIYCFSGCNLKFVYSKMPTPIDAKNAFDFAISKNSILYVPIGTIDNYKWDVEGWNNFKYIYEYDGTDVSNEKIEINHINFSTTPTGISIKCNNPVDIIIYDIQGNRECVKKRFTNGFICLPKGIHILKSNEQSYKIYI